MTGIPISAGRVDLDPAGLAPTAAEEFEWVSLAARGLELTLPLAGTDPLAGAVGRVVALGCVVFKFALRVSVGVPPRDFSLAGRGLGIASEPSDRWSSTPRFVGASSVLDCLASSVSDLSCWTKPPRNNRGGSFS